MIDASSSIKLEEFERIEAAPGTALLRIAARVPAGVARSAALTLIIEEQERVQRFPRLPAPPNPPGLLRAAFSAPVELIERRVSYRLELSDGTVIELPPPARRRRRLDRTPRAAPQNELAQQLDAERERRLQAESDAEQLSMARTQALTQLVELEADQHLSREAQAELHQVAAELRQRTEEADHRALELEQRLELQSRQSEQQLREAAEQARAQSDARAEVEQRLAESEAALGLAMQRIGGIVQGSSVSEEQLSTPRADPERANSDAEDVSRHFGHEAAAREEAQRLAETLSSRLGEARSDAERAAALEQELNEMSEASAALQAAQESAVKAIEAQLEGESAAAERIRALAALDAQTAQDAEHRASTELEQLRADLAETRALATQWQSEAERFQQTAGRALAEGQGLREAAARSRGDAGGSAAPALTGAREAAEEEKDLGSLQDAGATEHIDRVAAERELAERQAANRETLRQAREREREQRRRPSRKLPTKP